MINPLHSIHFDSHRSQMHNFFYIYEYKMLYLVVKAFSIADEKLFSKNKANLLIFYAIINSIKSFNYINKVN